jgi:hypothetical protein
MDPNGSNLNFRMYQEYCCSFSGPEENAEITSFNRYKMTNKCAKELVDFINVFQILPRHVSASGCHLQGVVGAL